MAVLAGGTVAVIKLIPEREDDTSTPSVETIKVLDKARTILKPLPLPIKAEHISFIPRRKRKKARLRPHPLPHQAAPLKRYGILTVMQRTL